MHDTYGQTLGKMFTNVKVIDVRIQKAINLKQALLRDSFPIFCILLLFILTELIPSDHLDGWGVLLIVVGSAFVLWHVLEVVTMLFNKKRRALHDYLAGTVVVRV